MRVAVVAVCVVAFFPAGIWHGVVPSTKPTAKQLAAHLKAGDRSVATPRLVFKKKP